MIKLLNKENGAPVQDIYSVEGKLWKLSIPVNSSLEVPEDVANFLLEKYGFLERDETELNAESDGVFYCKNRCGYKHDKRIGVLGHEKGCTYMTSEAKADTVDIQDVIPAMNKREVEVDYGPGNGPDSDGVEWYGDGLVEDRGSMSPTRSLGTKGHFGAA